MQVPIRIRVCLARLLDEQILGREIVPALSEDADRVVRVARREAVGRRVGRHEVERGRQTSRLGVASHALVVGGHVERVPFHQDARAVRTNPVVDLPRTVLEVRHEARAVADALPGVLRTGSGPHRAETVGHACVLHRDRKRKVDPVPAFQLPRVVHRANDRFRRDAAVRDDERIQRSRDVPALQRVDEPLKVGHVLILRVLPDPQAAVGGEAALEIRGLVPRRVGLVEVVVEHLREQDRVLVCRRRPEVVRVVIRRHEHALVIGQGAARTRDRKSGEGEEELRAAPQAGSNCLGESFVVTRGPHLWFIN